jgi:meiotic recombination protein SPO11
MESKKNPKFMDSCILLTGKGYPCMATRNCLFRISLKYPKLSMMALVDGDPHGIQIFLTYKYGSLAMAFDNARMAVPSLKFVGLSPFNWRELGISCDDLLKLKPVDMKKAFKLLSNPWIKTKELFLQRELQLMMKMNRKSEIQIVASGVLIHYIAQLID